MPQFGRIWKIFFIQIYKNVRKIRNWLENDETLYIQTVNRFGVKFEYFFSILYDTVNLHERNIIMTNSSIRSIDRLFLIAE